MKKWLCIPIAAYPYAYILASLIIAALSDVPFITDEAMAVISVLLVIGYQALVIAVLIYYIVLAAKNKMDAKKAAKLNLIVKGVHIPAYIFHFIVGLFGLLMSVWGIGLLMAAVIIDAVTIIVSGTFALCCSIRIKKENLMPTWAVILTAIGSYTFCADVVIAAVYGAKCLTKRNGSSLNPTN